MASDLLCGSLDYYALLCSVLAQKRDTQQIQSLSLKFDKPVDGDVSDPVSASSYIILQLNRSSMLLIVIDDLLTERPRAITSYYENREMQCLNICVIR